MTHPNFPFHHPFRVRYAEIDMQGVLFNAHYLTFADTAVTEYLRHVGLAYTAAEVQATGKDFHVVKATVEYKAPILFDEVVQVRVRVGRIGRSSIVWELGFFVGEEETARATAELIWVYTDIATHQSTPIPEEMKAQLTMNNEQICSLFIESGGKD